MPIVRSGWVAALPTLRSNVPPEAEGQSPEIKSLDILLPRDQLQYLLYSSYEQVPPGQESQRVDWDMLIQQMLVEAVVVEAFNCDSDPETVSITDVPRVVRAIHSAILNVFNWYHYTNTVGE